MKNKENIYKKAEMISVTPEGDSIRVGVEILAKGIVRIIIGSEKDVSPLPCLSLPAKNGNISKEKQNSIVGGGLTVDLQPDRFLLTVKRSGGQQLLKTSTQDLTQKGAIRVPPVMVSPTSISTSFRVDPDDHYLGYGEKFCAFDKRGLTIINDNSNAGGATSEQAYKNVPFFLNTRGFGVLFNTTRKIRHDVGEPGLSILSYLVEVGGSGLDFIVIDGPDPKDVLKRYSELTGFAPTPPLWSYGVWMSRFYFENWKSLLDASYGYRQHNIPCEVVAPDTYWLDGDRLCDLAWDLDRFPEPAKQISKLREDGFRICLWLFPYLSTTSPLFQFAEENDYLCSLEDGSTAIIATTLPKPCHDVEGFRGVGTLKHVFKHPVVSPGGLIDFTNPSAVDWYKGLLKERLQEGVSVFKTDFGEDVPDDLQFHDGRTGRDVHNIYPQLFQRTVVEATRDITGDSIIWGRSGWAGSQEFPIHWGGDPTTSFQAMSASLRGGLSYGLSGVPFWSHDIGGFAGPPPSQALFVRWAQFGLLSSHSRFHGTTPREPWEFGESAAEIVRKYAELRYRLLPYLYDLGVKAHSNGLPLIRPMYLEFPKDPGSRLVDHQFLLGPQLLVAPVFNGDGNVEVYLPSGADWIDLWSGNSYSGGQWLVESHLSLTHMPLFIRSNSIIPLVPVAQNTDSIDWARLSVLITDRAENSETFTVPDGSEIHVESRVVDDCWQGRITGWNHDVTLEIIGEQISGSAILHPGDWREIELNKTEISLGPIRLEP